MTLSNVTSAPTHIRRVFASWGYFSPRPCSNSVHFCCVFQRKGWSAGFWTGGGIVWGMGYGISQYQWRMEFALVITLLRSCGGFCNGFQSKLSLGNETLWKYNQPRTPWYLRELRKFLPYFWKSALSQWEYVLSFPPPQWEESYSFSCLSFATEYCNIQVVDSIQVRKWLQKESVLQLTNLRY